jgi:phasin family protein
MSNEIFETISELVETTSANCKKLGKANLELSEKLLQEQADLTSSLFEAAKAKAEKVAGAKDFQTVVSNQAELAQEAYELVSAYSKSCAEYVAEAGKFYTQLFEGCVKTANSNVGKAASKSKKSA